MRDPLADRPLASIRTADLAAWRNDRLAQGKAPTTIRNALTSIDGRVCQRPSECGAPFDRNRGLTRFLVRGAAKVKAVVLWLALANNLSCGWRLGAA